MTEICKTPNGTMTLRPPQAVGLSEAVSCGGLVAAIRTGGGKTLLSGLLPFVFDRKKPLLFVPAKLRQKTRIEFGKLRQHWQIPKEIRIESYEKLGLQQHEAMLLHYEPDLIICDEAQMLAHVDKSARARRIARYMRYFPECIFCAMTGTLGEIDEFAHLMIWALRDGAPVPKEPEEIQKWARILNAKVPDHERGDPEELVPHLGPSAIETPRQAFRDRLVHTPGVIVSVDKFQGSGLIVKPLYVDPAPEVEKAFTELRTVWEMPDGWSLADAAFEVWHGARQIGRGYYYQHDPRPPEPYRDIRKQYCKLVRYVIEASETLDTEKQVRDALESGRLKSPLYAPSPTIDPKLVKQAGVLGLSLFDAWTKIQPTYQPKRYPVWLSDNVLKKAIEWGRQGGGIIWVDSVAFGTELAERTGWGYFRNFGYDQRRRFIESDRVRGSETIIASITSNKEGRNLQHKWSRNLVIDPPSTGDDWEQFVSRTHRDGQRETTVYVDYMVTCYEDYGAIYNAVNQNECDHQTTGQNYRLLNGDVVMPSLVGRKGERAWQRSNKKNKVTID